MSQIHRKATVRCQSVAGPLWLYEYVRGTIDHCFLSFPFLLYSVCSPGGLRLKEGDTVTAARDLGPGNGHSI